MKKHTNSFNPIVLAISLICLKLKNCIYKLVGNILAQTTTLGLYFKLALCVSLQKISTTDPPTGVELMALRKTIRLMSCRLALVLFFLAIIPSSAFAWPTTAEWIGMYKGGGVLQDPTNDAGGARNIVDSSGHYAAYVFYDGTYFYTRLRLDADPTGSGGQGYLLQYGWGEEFDTDQDAGDYEWLTMVDGIGDHAVNNGDETIQLRQNTVKTNIGDPSDKAETLNSWMDLGGNFQVSLADTVTNGDADYFLDFRFPYDTLKTALGIDDYTAIRILFGSSSSTQSLVENGADLCGGTNLNLYTGLSDYVVPLGGTRPTDGTVWYRNSVDTADVTTENAGNNLYVKVQDLDRNINATTAQTVTVTLTVPSGDSETITLTETGVNTGIFWGSIPTIGSSTHTSDNGTLQVSDGEVATVTYTDAIAADLSHNVARTDTCTMSAPALSVTKSVSPARVVAGGTVDYTVTLRNQGGGPATVNSVVDTLPAGFTYVAFSTTGMTTGEPSISGQSLTWSGSWTLPANGTLTLHFQATASSIDGPYDNNVSFSGPGNPGTSSGPTATVGVVHIGIAKAASVSRVITGGTMSYTVTMTSTSNADTPVTEVTDTLPAGFAYVTGTSTGMTTNNPTVSGQTLTWSTGGPWNLPANGSLALTFNVTASSTAGTYNNNATFTPTGYPVRATGNTSPVEVVALTITKTANPTEVVKGGTVTYTIVMTNTSATSVSVTSVSDTLANTYSYIANSVTGLSNPNPPTLNQVGQTSTWTPTAPATSWTIPAASGGVPGSLTVTFNAQAPNSASGPDYNNASFNSTGFPTRSTGATAPVYVNVYTLNKSVSPSLVIAGGTVTYTLTFTNSSNSDETITQITDTLPSGFTYVTGSYGGTLGVAANPTGTTGTITWNGSWSLPKNASRTLTFNATASSTPGTYNNNAGWTLTGKTTNPTGNAAPVTVFDLTIAKTVDKAEVVDGDTVRYTMTLTNIGGPAITVNQVADTLPSGFTYVTGTTTGLTTNNPTGTTGTITWSTGGPWTLPASGTLTLSFDATASSTDGTYTNSASFTPASYPVRTVTGTAQVKVRHLTITKSVTPTSVVAGATVTYTMTLTNTGSTAVPVTRVTDTLPAGFTYVTGSYGGTLGVSADPSIGGQVLTWNGAWSILAGSSRTVTFSATASSVDGTYDNNCTFTPTGFPVRSSGATAPVTVIHLGLTKSVSPSSVVAGGTVTYTMTLSNTGSIAVPVTQITDTLPSGFTYVAGSYGGTLGVSANPSGTTGTITWNGSWSIPAGSSRTVTFSATASSTDGTYNNSATFTPTGYPVQSVNNTAPVTVIHLSIAKTANPTDVLAGGLLSYTITLSTTGSLAVPVTQVTDTLPSGFTYVTNTTTGLTTNNPGIAGQVHTWNGAWSIPAGGSLTLNFQATASSTDGTYNNNATYTPTGYPVQSVGPTATVTVIHLGISKTANPTSVLEGRTVGYTITLSSTSGSAITVTQVTDTLPAGFTYKSGTTGGTLGVSADPSGTTGTITWNGSWNIPAGGSRTLSFDTTATSTPGSYDNNASFTPTGYQALSTGNTATVVVVSNPQITLVKSVDKTDASPGDVLTYTVHYHNSGGSQATSLIILDPIPAYTSYVTGSQKVGNAASTYATATTIADNVSGGSVTFMVGTVEPDDSVPDSGNDEGKVYLQLSVNH